MVGKDCDQGENKSNPNKVQNAQRCVTVEPYN